MIAGTDENNIYCFEINEIFDMDIKSHEFKFIESNDEVNEKKEKNESFHKLGKMGSGSISSFDYLQGKQ